MIPPLNRSRSISDSVATCSLLVTLAILIGVGILSYHSTLRFLQNDQQVDHTYQVLDSLGAILSDLRDAETGQRGYLLTGESQYLEPYRIGAAALQRDTQSVRTLTRDNPSQQRRLDTLQAVSAAKVAELGQTITLRQQVGVAAALKVVMTGRGKDLMDQARGVVMQMRAEEQRLLAERTAAAEAAGGKARLWDIIGSVMAILLIVNAIGFVSRYLHQRGRAEAENLQLAEAARDSALQQRLFLKDVLSSVTEGRLALCDTVQELPPPLLTVGEPIPLTREGGARNLRQVAVRAARTCGFPEERVQDLATSVSEAGMNAITHGGGGHAVVSTDNCDRVQVRIVDQGKGIALNTLPQSTLERGYSSAGSLGHGFWLMLRMTDRVSLLTGPHGTTVVLEQDRVQRQAPWVGRGEEPTMLTFRTLDSSVASESASSGGDNPIRLPAPGLCDLRRSEAGGFGRHCL